jgi:hypothetical protein
MKRLLFAAVTSLLYVSVANAAVTSIPILDGSGATQHGAFSLDAGSLLYPLAGLCGGAAAAPGTTIAQCAIVNSSGQILTLDTQSGTWNITNITGTISLPTGAMPATGGTVGLVAGATIIGKVGIDQTTPGTTNGVSIQGCAPGICGLPTVTANALVQGRISTAMTATTATSLIPLVTSQRIYVTSVACKNTSATATLVNITDGSGGTILAQLAAGATYGGDNLQSSAPLFWTTAGNALFAVNVTTGASTTCNAAGYSSAN